MGYTHYWKQKRAFTTLEWQRLLAEAQRICAKAQRALYSGKEDFASSTRVHQDDFGARTGFNEEGAWRTFANPEIPTPMQGAAIRLAGPSGDPNTRPEFTAEWISLNGCEPEDYETFHLERAPVCPEYQLKNGQPPAEGIFGFTKTEYRPYDAVVVSILAAARLITPDAITVTSDGGDEVIRLMF